MLTILTIILAGYFNLNLSGTYFGVFLLDLTIIAALSDYLSKDK